MITMQSKLGKNYILNMSYQILLILIPIITMPYISRVLGANGVGIYNYTYSVVTAFTLIAVLGTNSYAIREIAYVQEDKIACSKLFYEITFIRLITTIILIPIYFCVASLSKQYLLVYIVATTYLIDVPFDISWFFQGLEEFKKTVSCSILVRILGVVLIFLYVKNSDDIAKYIFIMGSTTLLGHIALWWYLPKHVEKPNLETFHPFRHLKSVLVFFIPASSAYIYTSLDKIVLGVFSTEAEVGYFSQSEKILKLLITVITALSTVLMPRMANMIKKGEIEDVSRNINKSYQFVLMLSFPMMVGLAIVTEYFVPLFLGDGYNKSIPLMYILIPLIIIMGMASMTGTPVMLAMGQQKKYNSIIVSASVINLILNLLLVKNWGSFGVALATIVAEGYVTACEMYSIRNLIDFNLLVRHFWRYLINAAIMGVPLLLLKSFISGTWFGVIVLAMAGIFIYFIIMTVEKDSMLKIILNMGKNILKK